MRRSLSLVISLAVAGPSLASAQATPPSLPLTLIWEGAGVCDGQGKTETAVALALASGPRLGGDLWMLPDPTLYGGVGAWRDRGRPRDPEPGDRRRPLARRCSAAATRSP